MSEAVETEMVGNFKIEIFQDDAPQDPREWDNLGHMVCWHKDVNLGDETRRDSQEDWLQELAEAVDDTVEDRIWFWENGKGYEKIFNNCAKEFPDKKWMDRPTFDRVNKKVMAIVYKAIEEHYIMLLYSHSGITMHVGSQAHPFDPGGWDFGQVGWIYVTKKNIREEYGWKVLTKKRIETIEGYLKNEVQTYDRFITGRVYGFVVTEHGTCKHCGAKIEVDVESCWGHFMDSGDLLEDVKKEVQCYESELGESVCPRFLRLRNALEFEEEMFNFVSKEDIAALAGRIDARMEGTV
jgi:hypothetical protein